MQRKETKPLLKNIMHNGQKEILTVNPEESTDFLPTKWNNKAYMMNGFVRRRFMLNQLINLIKIIKPQSILEVGCGYGFILFYCLVYFQK